MIKKFKKTDTFGEKNQWQIDPAQRKEIMKILGEQSDFMMCEEALDDLVPVLHFLGYVEYEK